MSRIPRSSAEALIATVTEIARLPYGTARSEAAAAAVRRSEEPGCESVEPYALAGLVDALFWGGEVVHALVPFSPFARLWDRHPERFDDVDTSLFLNAFAWILGGLQDDPSVPAETVERLLEDMATRYAVAGRAPNAPAYERLRWAVRCESPDAEAAYERWLREPEEPEDVCEHCRRTRRGIFLSREGRWEELVGVLGAPGLPEEGCPTEPADMLSVLALGHLELGRTAQAVAVHRRAEAALARAGTAMEGARGRRIALLGRGGQHASALRAIEDDQHVLHAAITPFWRMQFLAHVGSATGAIRRAAPATPVHLVSVPARTVAELDDWVRAQALELADAFGSRAGSRRPRRRVLEILDAPEVSLDLGTAAPPTASGGAAPVPADVGVSAEEALALAEAAAATDPLAAIASYRRAVELAGASGDRRAAGWAAAEAARLAHGLGEVDGAHTDFAAAVGLLRAGGLPDVDLVPVLTAWSESAARVEGGSALLVEIARALAAPDIAEDDPLPAAHLHDARARYLAAATVGAARVEALAAARTDALVAAETFAGSGAIDDAGHAFWLAGRLALESDDLGAAVWGLESAVEAFGITQRSGFRAEAASELITALRRAGREDEVDAVVALLTRR